MPHECVLYSALLKTVLCSKDNRIKCHTKVHTESVLLFSFLVEDISHHCFHIILILQHAFIHKASYMSEEIIYLKYFLLTIVMATIPTTSKPSASTGKENRIGYETNLNAENINDEIHTDNEYLVH